MSQHRPSAVRGAVLDATVHVVLLLLVLGQLVFLATRYRARFDLTADGFYSLTDSTRDLLAKLEHRLLIEAYFSPKDKLPGQYREGRVYLDNFLDELVQLGKGKVVVQRFDPGEDKAIADKCQRLGIKPIDLQSATSQSIEVNRTWQGLRLVYGGEKQKVLEQLPPATTFGLEVVITPAIKEVLTKGKRKFGFMEWAPDPAQGGQQNQPPGWNAVRSFDDVAKRYEFQNLKDPEGALLPADYDTLFLFRPKEVTDRQKYVLDQFLLRGGTVVAFVDVADYAIGPYRSFNRMPVNFDAPGSQHKLLEQLRAYGVDITGKLVADAAPQAMQGSHPLEYLSVVRQGPFGQQPTAVAYPYFFHALPADWRNAANQLATDQRTGAVDADLAARFRERFQPGLDEQEFLFQTFKKQGRGPGLYWPCWVDLRRKAGALDLPSGIDGKVLMWSSPLTLVEDPPQDLNPLRGQDAQSQNLELQKFLRKISDKLQTEQRQQAPLMVSLRGKFHSFFEGKERPKKASELKEEEEQRKAAAEQPPVDPVKDPQKGQPEAPKKGGPRLQEPAPQGQQPPPGQQPPTGQPPVTQEPAPAPKPVTPPVVEPKPQGQGVTPPVVEPKPQGQGVTPPVVEPKPQGQGVTPPVVEPKPEGKGEPKPAENQPAEGKPVTPPAVDPKPPAQGEAKPPEKPVAPPAGEAKPAVGAPAAGQGAAPPAGEPTPQGQGESKPAGNNPAELKPDTKAQGEAKPVPPPQNAPPKPQPQGPVPQPNLLGPPPPPQQEQPKPEPDPAPLLDGTAPGRIIVVGDADFLRDDLVRGDHQQRGGPVSIRGPMFFFGMLDWLSQDRDLLALTSRVPQDRALKFVEHDLQKDDQAEFEKRTAAKTARLQWLNVLLPPLVFALIGVIVWLVRRAEKQSFLSAVDN